MRYKKFLRNKKYPRKGKMDILETIPECLSEDEHSSTSMSECKSIQKHDITQDSPKIKILRYKFNLYSKILQKKIA